MHVSGGTADAATGGGSRLRALVHTSPTHEFDSARGTFSPTTSTLITGRREAVLIDAQFMASDVAALGDTIEDSGKELTAIYITHGHADHHFGLGPLLARFPRARALATPGVIDYITANSDNETGLWEIMFGDRFVRPTVVPEPLDGDKIELEDAELRIVEVGQGDIRPSTVVHVPAIGTVVSGDVVYNRVHVMLAMSTPDEWQQWLTSVDAVEALSPRSIIAGHKAPGASDEDVRGMLDGTRAYIRDFAAAASAAGDAEQLIATILDKHPECVNLWTLQYSANAALQRRHERDG
ncbi:MAG TPA: MBL fold metallo-hydrolase [Solirubrobacteraceae bacterium]|jgi:glyoxylase-like metal-dependent hydrolase (beta-lactamase superfamily II)|nr:MBL fold metallo-hydrolase [Solirubrobacteraceae bacterium]